MAIALSVAAGLLPAQVRAQVVSASDEPSVVEAVALEPRYDLRPVPLISVEGPSGPVTEGGDVVFTLTRTRNTVDSLTVHFWLVPAGVGFLYDLGDTPPADDFPQDFVSGDLPSSVTFAAGVATTTVVVPTTDDNVDEPHGELWLHVLPRNRPIFSSAHETVWWYTPATTNTRVTLLDNDVAEVTISGAPSVVEGGHLRFRVEMSIHSTRDIRIPYTLSGTARSGPYYDYLSPTYTDYLLIRGTDPRRVTDDAPSLAFNIRTIDDDIYEGDETVTVTLGAPAGGEATVATLGSPGTATGTIIDDENPPLVTVAGPRAPVIEGRSALFTLRRTGNTDEELTVPFTTREVPGGFTSGSAIFAARSDTVRVIVPTRADNMIDEPDGELTLTLTPDQTTHRVGDPGTVTVEDDDVVVVTISGAPSVVEGGPLSFTVERDIASTRNIAVPYVLSGPATSGEDYIVPSALVLPAGSTADVSFTITTIDDDIDELDETVTVTLQAPADRDAATLGTTKVATGTIIDNDLPVVTVVATPSTVTEGRDAVFTLTRKAADVSGSLTVPFMVDDPGGFASGASLSSATIAAGSTTATVTVPTTDDRLDEPDGELTLTLTPGQSTHRVGDPGAATVTVEDDDVVVVTISGAPSVFEGAPLSFTVGRDIASTRAIVVPYTLSGTATSGEDYTVPGALVLPADTSGDSTFTIETIDDEVDEPDETVTVTLQAPADSDAARLGVPSAATGTIIDSDLPVVTVVTTTPVVTEGRILEFTASREGDTTGALTVSFTIIIPAEFAGGVLSSATFEFEAGSATATVTLGTHNDRLDEPDGVVNLFLLSGFDYRVGDPDTATVTVVDDDVVVVTISDAPSVVEGGTLRFTVGRDIASTRAIVVPYTLSGTATSGEDYTAPSGSVTLPALSTSDIILAIGVDDDDIDEPDETVTVTLGPPADGDTTIARLGAATEATGTILDDDLPVVTVAGPSGAVPEGGDVVFTLRRTGDTGAALTVRFTVSDPGGFASGARPTSARFSAGSATRRVTIPTTDDDVDESDGTLTLTLTSGQATYRLGTPATAAVTVADDDAPPGGGSIIVPAPSPPVVSVVDAPAAPEGGDLVFEVTLERALRRGLTVTYTLGGTAAAGADYTVPSGSVTIPAGWTTAMVTVATTDDDIDEPAEAVAVTLTSVEPQGAATLAVDRTATGTIIDNDVAVVTVADAPSTAEGGTLLFTVTSTLTSTRGIVVPYTLGGTATAGMDYTAPFGSVEIAAGSTTAMVTVATIDDDIDEPEETVIVTLGAPADSASARLGADMAAGTAAGTIIDNDVMVVTVADAATTAEGGSLSFTVRSTLTSSRAITVPYTLGGTATTGTDYTEPDPLEATIAAGATTATVTVATTEDMVDEPDETVTVTLTGVEPPDAATLGAGTVATGTITDNDMAMVMITDAPPVAEGGTLSFTVTSTLTSSRDIVVPYMLGGTATAGTDYTAPSGSVTIPTGSTSASLTIATADDMVDEPDETVTVTLVTPADSASVRLRSGTAATGTVTDDDVAVVTITDAPSAAEGGSLAFTVMSSLASSRAITVPYTISGTAAPGADYTAPSGSVTIAAGRTMATVTVAILDDDADEPAETVVVTLGAPADSASARLGSGAAATGTITDNDLPLVTAAATTSTVTEGEAVIFILTRTGDTSGALTVAFTVADPGGFAPGALSASATFAASSPTVTVIIGTTDDDVDEPNGTLTLALTAAPESHHTGLPTVATVLDNEDLPELSVAGPTAPVIEGGVLAFTVTASRASSRALTVAYMLGGTATVGADYVAPSGSATIAAGQTMATIAVVTTDDDLDELAEAVIVTLTGVGPRGAATLAAGRAVAGTITDNDLPLVTAAGPSGAVTEGDDATFTLNRTGDASGALTVPFTLSDPGGFVAGALPVSATFAAGSAIASVTVATEDDAIEEGSNGVLTLTLTAAPAAYRTGLPATATVRDNDGIPVVSVASPAAPVPEGGDLVFRLELTMAAEMDLTVAYKVGGTARAADHDGRDGGVVVPAGELAAEVRMTTVDDSIGEPGGETVTVTLVAVKPDGAAVLALAPPAVATIGDNDDPLAVSATEKDTAAVEEIMVHLGATVLTQVVEAVKLRVEAPRLPEIRGTVAGRPVRGAPGGRGAGGAGRARLAVPLAAAADRDLPTPHASKTVDGREALGGTSFVATQGTEGDGHASVWGRGSWMSFAGREAALEVEGDVLTGQIGTDWSVGPWVVGLSVGHSVGETGYRGERRGDIETEVTGVYPYVGYSLTERLSVWAAGGRGEGTLTLTPEGRLGIETGLDFAMGAAGVRAELLMATVEGGLALAAKADATVVRMTTDEADRLAASTTDSERMRFGLEVAVPVPTGGGATLTPLLELGVLHDGGDSEGGAGADIGLGAAWAGHGLFVDVRTRVVALHEASGGREWGVTGELRYDLDPSSGRGFALSLASGYGVAASGGVDALFGLRPADRLADGGVELPDMRGGAEVSYGLGVLDGRFTSVPWAGVRLEDGGAELRLGWRIEPVGPDASSLRPGVELYSGGGGRGVMLRLDASL